MDQEIRNKLRSVVTQCRRLLEDAISQELEGKYAIFARKDLVTADPSAPMAHLSDDEQAARRDILDHYAHIQARGFKPKDALDQLIREIAFTHLNRLCAYKMMEAREVYVGGQKFREAVSRGVNSKGVKFYLAEHPEEERLFNTGHQDVAYRHFLDWLGGELSDEIGVLFSPNDPANRLYPRQKTFEEVLNLLNQGGIKAEETELQKQWPLIWSQDETIGWVYQYFTPKELRDAARNPKRGGSQVPRNSYELAFRNQFFTPRYVVEFLTDNTLGRIWYEMRKGDTKLAKEGDPAQCRYMVRRPTEIFLTEGEQPPADASEGQDNLSPEELLKLPVHLPHRPKKDPRELKILDPACGSGHFLLYCFDLLLTIYEEAYTDPDLGPSLKQDYSTLDALKRDVPRLILAHNLHGIDIDLRASQIAALALWLRCQRAYQEMGLKKDRPQITRSNFVCAEPMPGEREMLKEFVSQLEPRVLGQVVEVVFDKMKLAGEAGSLLKIEEEIQDAISEAKRQFAIGGIPIQRTLFDKTCKPVVKVFSVKDITDALFFESAESQVIDALRSYAEKAQDGQRLQRRLFAEDTVRGFAFVDLCQQRFDVVLMNPPFGSATASTAPMLLSKFKGFHNDILAAFVARGHGLLASSGKVGAITSRTCLVKRRLADFRSRLLIPYSQNVLDLGKGIMDEAMVESCAYVLDHRVVCPRGVAIDVRSLSKARFTHAALNTQARQVFDRERLLTLHHCRFLYSLPYAVYRLLTTPLKCEPEVWTAREGMKSFNNERFIRLKWEVPAEEIGEGRKWEFYVRSEGSVEYRADAHLLLKWENDGHDLKLVNIALNGSTAQVCQASTYWRRFGCTYSRRSKTFAVRLLPAGCIFSDMGPALLPLGSWSPFAMLAFGNSRLVRALTLLQAHASDYQTGIVKNIPLPPDYNSLTSDLSECGEILANAQGERAKWDETDCCYVFAPKDTLLAMREEHTKNEALCRSIISRTVGKVDDLLENAFGVVAGEWLSELERASDGDDDETVCGDEQSVDLSVCPARHTVAYAMGCVFERWRLRRCSDELPALTVSEYSVANVRSLVMSNDERPDSTQLCLEVTSPELRASGILPDDPKHDHDIGRQVRRTLDFVWGGQAEEIEKEACQLLGVDTLREYMQKSGKGGFWSDHIDRYSKSHRAAPIYWLLQSSKKGYALWLYYHQLNKDLLFKALVNYVEPKIRLESSHLELLRSAKAAAGDNGKEAKRLAKDVERQEDFLSELRDFEDKLRRAANLHLEPDLNDGVVLNIAPLWELVPWKEAKKYWDELMDGEYEWSSIGKQLRQRGLVK